MRFCNDVAKRFQFVDKAFDDILLESKAIGEKVSKSLTEAILGQGTSIIFIAK